MDTKGEVIPGLFAAGESQGGFGQHGLGRSFVYGRIAGIEPNLEISQRFPSEVAAGSELTFKVRIECPFGCDLRGSEVVVEAAAGPVTTSELVSWDEGINETGEVTLRAPSEIGEHEWSVSCRPQTSEPPGHTGISLPLPFSTEAPARALDVSKDLTVRVEVAVLPDRSSWEDD